MYVGEPLGPVLAPTNAKVAVEQGATIRRMKRYSAFCSLRDNLLQAFPALTRLIDTLPRKSLGAWGHVAWTTRTVLLMPLRFSQIPPLLPGETAQAACFLAQHRTAAFAAGWQHTSQSLDPGVMPLKPCYYRLRCRP